MKMRRASEVTAAVKRLYLDLKADGCPLEVAGENLVTDNYAKLASDGTYMYCHLRKICCS